MKSLKGCGGGEGLIHHHLLVRDNTHNDARAHTCTTTSVFDFPRVPAGADVEFWEARRPPEHTGPMTDG